MALFKLVYWAITFLAKLRFPPGCSITTFNGLQMLRDPFSQLNNGCWYLDPVLVPSLWYFVLFSNQTSH